MGRRNSEHIVRHQTLDYKPRGFEPTYYDIDTVEDMKDAIIDCYYLLNEEEEKEFFDDLIECNDGNEITTIEQYVDLLNDNYCEFGNEWEIV